MALRKLCAVQLQALLFVAVLLLPFSISTPVRSHKRQTLRQSSGIGRRQGGFFSVLGAAAVGDGLVHPRLEIRELEKKDDQWNVYLLGLRRFQNMDQGDQLSYYQIAGIHGRPWISWDGVNIGPPGSGGGYCPHGSNIFPTWHRPFLALFEEVLYLNARAAIAEFPNGALKDRYNEALGTFRMPYWDWAAVPANGEGLPLSLQRPTVDIVFSNGTVNVPNPLFSYRFHPLNTQELPDTPYSRWPTTIRDPSSRQANAASRNDLVSLALKSNQPNLQSRIYNVLAMQHSYLQISNDFQPGDSIESVHDTIHNVVGGDGHMSQLAYSAFDPIFWLHHTNVDRIFAIWQALNPNEYVTPFTNPYATYTTPGGSESDVNTPLTPFHRNDAGDHWTSETIRYIPMFGYTYPELLNIGNNTSSLITRVNELYGPDVGQNAKGSISRRAVAGAPSFTGKRKYTTNIKLNKFDIGGSLNVYISLDDGVMPQSGSNSLYWLSAESFVGMTGILSRGMGADKSRSGVGANGEVPLTAALEEKVRSGELTSMQEEEVSRYLKKWLKWRVARMNGEEVPVESIPGMQVSVLWAEIEPERSTKEFPKMVGEYRALVDATDGRPGGFGKGDSL